VRPATSSLHSLPPARCALPYLNPVIKYSHCALALVSQSLPFVGCPFVRSLVPPFVRSLVPLVLVASFLGVRSCTLFLLALGRSLRIFGDLPGLEMDW